MTSAQTTEAGLSVDELRAPDVPLQPGEQLRIYSMRMCPYAQRARLTIVAKGVKYDLVNVDLNKKPQWFFELNPYGEVPVILHDDGVVFESLVAAEYLEEAFPEPKLYSDNPLVRAHEKIFINHWTKKGIPAFYSLLKTGYAEPTLTKRLEEHVAVMNTFLHKLDRPFFHGHTVGFPDYMIWPWFERMPMMKDITEFTISADTYPHITAWMKRMLNDPVVKKCMIDPELMTQHYAHYRTGKPDFTIGAECQKTTIVPEALENLDGLRDPTTRDRQKD